MCNNSNWCYFYPPWLWALWVGVWIWPVVSSCKPFCRRWHGQRLGIAQWDKWESARKASYYLAYILLYSEQYTIHSERYYWNVNINLIKERIFFISHWMCVQYSTVQYMYVELIMYPCINLQHSYPYKNALTKFNCKCIFVERYFTTMYSTCIGTGR